MHDAAALPLGITVLERGWLSSNNVILHGSSAEEGAVLVDTGYATHAAQTLALVSAALRPGETIRLIVNTHLHSDHCGGNAALAAQYACPVHIPSGEFEAVAIWDEARLSYRSTGQQCPRFSAVGILSPGAVLDIGTTRWSVHAAPGHDPHSVMLFEANSRTLISADALWERGFGIVFPEIDGENAFDQVAATLDVIEALDPVWIIPGHGAPFKGLQTALTLARSRLEHFRRAPARHAISAAKALTVFHMLEVLEQPLPQLLEWLCATPILQSTWNRFAGDVPLTRWGEGVVLDLVNAGSLSASASSAGIVIRAVGT